MTHVPAAAVKNIKNAAVPASRRFIADYDQKTCELNKPAGLFLYVL